MQEYHRGEGLMHAGVPGIGWEGLMHAGVPGIGWEGLMHARDQA